METTGGWRVRKKQAPETGFNFRGKELIVRKVLEGEGMTIHVELFGLNSDRFLRLLHGFNLRDRRFRSTNVLYSVELGIRGMKNRWKVRHSLVSQTTDNY